MTSTPAGSVAPAARGATHVADKVVALIAEQAAREALHEGPASPSTADAHATVTVRHSDRRARDNGEYLGEARVRLRVDLGYPVDVGARCRAVRRRVSEQVIRLAGMSISGVTVHVQQLHPAQKGREGERRVR